MASVIRPRHAKHAANYFWGYNGGSTTAINQYVSDLRAAGIHIRQYEAHQWPRPDKGVSWDQYFKEMKYLPSSARKGKPISMIYWTWAGEFRRIILWVGHVGE